MFGISGVELVIILLFAFLIVGPEKLPDAAKTIGKAIAKFQDAQSQMNDVIKTESENIKSEVMSAAESQKTTRTVTRAPEQSAGAASSPAPAAEETTEVAPVRTMSFSERKAQYEKERAAKRAAEAEAAKAATSEKAGEE